jgi:hypothetical protein
MMGMKPAMLSLLNCCVPSYIILILRHRITVGTLTDHKLLRFCKENQIHLIYIRLRFRRSRFADRVRIRNIIFSEN